MQFSQDDRSGWTHVETPTTFGNADDGCQSFIPLGFTYTGFGANTTSVSVSTNGVLFFGQNCSTTFTNTTLPFALSTDAMLFFFWDDLQDFGVGEYLEYKTFGSAGGLVFNLYFRSRLHDAACGTDAINAMVSIHQGSNLIKVVYSGMSGCEAMRGGSATLGFQTSGGTSAKAFTIGVNSPVLNDNASFQTMSFHPPN
jgi:hypothetical protein